MSHPYSGGRTGIETVHERGQGAYQFGTYYDSLCALQSSVPLPSVKANLDKNVLLINADKIRLADWPPILKAVQINKSIEKISVLSYYDPELEPAARATAAGTPTHRPSYTPSKQKLPPVHSKDMTYQLCRAIRDCLVNSERLKCVELEGLPLRSRDVTLLSKGISGSCCLKEVSFECSHVGDTLTVLCDGLKNASTVNILNLSGCSLADGAVEAISRVVKHQAIMRHSEAWKSSLRYRAPDLDCMPGLRRITLNRNPLLGDDGAKALSDALKDDLWLKAIDIQECGLTDVGAEYLLDALRLNSTVLVVDIRGNHMVNRSLVERVIQQVMINSDGKNTQFSWLPVEPKRKESFVRRSGRSPSSKKSAPRFKVPSKSKTLIVSPSRKRSAPATTASPPITPRDVPKQRGLPWRTAERANVHKCIDDPDKRRTASPSADESRESRESEGDADNTDLSLLGADGGRSTSPARSSRTDHQTLSMLKELQAENISLKRRLAEESTARLAAEDRALELARENRRLQSQLRRASLADGNADEELLTQVETAFSKFNQFLDLVRDTGLGHLIHEAGLDTFAGATSPIPSLSRHTDPNSTGADRTPNYQDYALRRQIALQSDDIIPPTLGADSHKKSYAEIKAAESIKALAAAVKSPPKSDSLAPSPSKTKKKRKEKPKSDSRDVADSGPDLASGTYKLKAFELKDVSELETPKLTPRAQLDLMKSTEGFPQLPEDYVDARPPATVQQAPADTEAGPVQAVSLSARSEPAAEDVYSSNDFASVSASVATSVTASNKWSASDGSDRREEAGDLSEPDLSPIVSYSDSDNPHQSDMLNIKSLSELGSSVEDITSTQDH